MPTKNNGGAKSAEAHSDDSESELLGEDYIETTDENNVISHEHVWLSPNRKRAVKFQDDTPEKIEPEGGQERRTSSEADESLKNNLNAFSIWRPSMRRMTSSYSGGEKAENEGEEVELLSTDQTSTRLEAYESIGVVAALLAGFAFGGLTAVDEEELRNSNSFVIIGFAFTTSFTIALNFYTVVAATWIYYWGRLLLGHGANMPAELFLANETVQTYRRSAVWALMVSIPVFCLSMCFLVFVKLTQSVAVVCAAFFLVVTFVCLDMSRQMKKAFHVSKFILEHKCTIEEAEQCLQNAEPWYNLAYDSLSRKLNSWFGLSLYVCLVATLYYGRLCEDGEIPKLYCPGL